MNLKKLSIAEEILINIEVEEKWFWIENTEEIFRLGNKEQVRQGTQFRK